MRIFYIILPHKILFDLVKSSIRWPRDREKSLGRAECYDVKSRTIHKTHSWNSQYPKASHSEIRIVWN